MASFMDYYERELSRLRNEIPIASAPVSRPRPPVPVSTDISGLNPSGTDLASGPDKSDEPQSPVSWLFDILSRPLYGVTNQIDKNIENVTQIVKNTNEGNFNWGDVGKAVGDSLTAGARGFFGTNPEDHKTGSDVIESATDNIGSIDPKYVNEEDNVKPWVKGTLGLAGDIALDPLTYLGAAPIKAGIRAVKSAAKGTEVAEDVGRSANTTRRISDEGKEMIKRQEEADALAESVVKQADEAPAPKSDAEALLDDLTDADFTPPSQPKPVSPVVSEVLGETPKATYKAQLAIEAPKPIPSAPLTRVTNGAENLTFAVGRAGDVEPLRAETAIQDLLSRTPSQKKISQSIAESPEAAKRATSVIDEILSPPKEGAAPKPKVRADGKPLSPGEWLDEAERLAPSLGRTGIRLRGYSPTPFSVIREGLERKDPSILADLKEGYEQYARAFNKSGGKVDPFRNDFSSYKSTPTDPRSYFDYLTETDATSARLEEALGSRALDQLKKSSDHFEDILREMRGVASGRTNVDKILSKQALAPGEKTMIRQLTGIQDPVAHNQQVQRWLAESGPQPEKVLGPGQLPEMSQIDRMEEALRGGSTLNQTDKVAAESLDTVFKGLKKELEDTHQYLTKRGHYRDSKTLGEGTGIRADGVNTHTQWNIHKEIFNRVYKEFKKNPRETAGAARAQALRDASMPSLRKAFQLLDDFGVPSKIGHGEEAIPLNMAQVSDIMTAHGARDLELMALWNKSTAVNTTNFLDAVLKAYHGAPKNVIAKELGKTVGRNEKKLPVTLFNSSEAGTVARYGRREVTGAELVEGMSNYLSSPAFRESLKDVVQQNAERYARKEAKQYGKIVGDQTAILAEAGERRGFETLMKSINRADMSAAREAVQVGAYVTSGRAAVKTVREVIPPHMRTESDALSKIDKKLADPNVTPDQAAKHLEQYNAARLDDAAKEAEEVAEQAMRETKTLEEFVETFDISPSAATAAAVNSGMSRMLRGLRSTFDKQYNAELFYRDMLNAQGIVGDWMNRIGRPLGRIAKEGAEIVPGTKVTHAKAAWDAIRTGGNPANEKVAKLMKEFETITDDLFGTANPEFSAGKMAFRNGKTVDNINDALARVGEDFTYSMDDAVEAAKNSGKSVLHELGEQWRNFNGDDPIQFIRNYSAAMTRIATSSSIAQSMVREGVKNGFASTKYVKGFVKLSNDRKGSMFFPYLPKNVYVHPEAAQHIRQLDKIMSESSRFQGTFGKFMYEGYMPMLRAWKTGMTIYRPGHHIRNAVGDVTGQFLSMGLKGFRKANIDSLKILRHHEATESVDYLKMLENLGETKLSGAGEVLSKGKYGKLTDQDIYRAAQKQGIFPDYHTAEELYRDQAGTGKFARAMEKLAARDTKLERFAGGASQARDHWTRLSHFIQFINREQARGRAKYRSLDEMLKAASEEVAKWHPTGKELTGRERKWLLPLIPFYNWTKGIAPAVVSSLIMNPGRVTLFNKASYNLAVANGINPDSLSNPYPDDQLFPSFFKEESFGPQFQTAEGQYLRMNPGFITQDFLDTFGSNPLEGVLGSLSPILKAPVELRTESKLDTQGRIYDKSDYIDSSTPVLNYISNITGYSPTGSVVSGLQGKGLDMQAGFRENESGETKKSDLDKKLSWQNWLSGMSVANLSRPNYINYAEIEKRNREGRDGFEF